MFILILFGYKQSKIFTIDCLAASLFDCIWSTSTKQILKNYSNKQLQFSKQIQDRQKRIQKAQKRVEELDVKIKQEQQANPDKKKDEKPVKKGGKETVIISSPLEQEKIQQLKQAQDSKTAVNKYNEKLVKIKQLTSKLNLLIERVSKQELFLQLVDKTGQRKFIKSKLDSYANTFLSDKGTYYICTGWNTAEGSEQFQPLVIDGYPVRTVEQDLAAGSQEVFSLKKQEKDKKTVKKK